MWNCNLAICWKLRVSGATTKFVVKMQPARPNPLNGRSTDNQQGRLEKGDMKDQEILAHASVTCSCGWHGDIGLMAAEKATPPESDIYRWDFRCPECYKVLVYGSIPMGLFAKEGVLVTETYSH